MLKHQEDHKTQKLFPNVLLQGQSCFHYNSWEEMSKQWKGLSVYLYVCMSAWAYLTSSPWQGSLSFPGVYARTHNTAWDPSSGQKEGLVPPYPALPCMWLLECVEIHKTWSGSGPCGPRRLYSEHDPDTVRVVMATEPANLVPHDSILSDTWSYYCLLKWWVKLCCFQILSWFFCLFLVHNKTVTTSVIPIRNHETYIKQIG